MSAFVCKTRQARKKKKREYERRERAGLGVRETGGVTVLMCVCARLFCAVASFVWPVSECECVFVKPRESKLGTFCM